MASRLLAEAQATAAELTETCLDRIAKRDGAINAFRQVPRNDALSRHGASCMSAILAGRLQSAPRYAQDREFRRGNGGQLPCRNRGSAIAATRSSIRPAYPAGRSVRHSRGGAEKDGNSTLQASTLQATFARRRLLPSAGKCGRSGRRGPTRKDVDALIRAAMLTLAAPMDSAETFPFLNAPTTGIKPRQAVTARSGLHDDGMPVRPCPPCGESPGVLIPSQPAQTTLLRKGLPTACVAFWNR